MFRNAGEYPAPLARDFPISADAERYYKSGEQFLYKRLPFWLASLVDRLLVLVLPLLVVIVPGDAHRAGDLPLARALAHLPLVRRADGDRARHAAARPRPSRRDDDHRGASTRSRAPSTSSRRRCRSPTSSTSCATTSLGAPPPGDRWALREETGNRRPATGNRRWGDRQGWCVSGAFARAVLMDAPRIAASACASRVRGGMPAAVQPER